MFHRIKFLAFRNANTPKKYIYIFKIKTAKVKAKSSKNTIHFISKSFQTHTHTWRRFKQRSTGFHSIVSHLRQGESCGSYRQSNREPGGHIVIIQSACDFMIFTLQRNSTCFCRKRCPFSSNCSNQLQLLCKWATLRIITENLSSC